MPRYKVLGTDIDAVDLKTGLSQAQGLIAAEGSHYLTLPYVEFLVQAQRNAAIRQSLNQADMRLPNGVALIWAIQYLYGGQVGLVRLIGSLFSIVLRPSQVHQLAPSRFDSTNFTWELLQRAADQGQSVYLIGSPKRQTIEQTAKHLHQAIPGLNIAGVWPGYFNKAAEIRLIQELRQLNPDLILVGIGFPRQEQLMQRLQSELPHGLMIGEGGSFDYEQYGGQIKRAPSWLRRIGLEWLWRLILEPSRLKRQVAIPKFIWLVYQQGRTGH